MKFTWLGGPSFVLELGPFRVACDLVLTSQFELPGHGTVTRTATSSAPEAFTAVCDLTLVTSLRPDHFDGAALARRSVGTVVTPVATNVASARTLAWGESIRLEKNGAVLLVTAVPAGSGNSSSDRDNGYFLRLEGGAQPFTVYITGDVLFSEATRELQRTHGYSNLLVLYIGGERATDGSPRSADSKDAMQIVYRMQPNAIAAVHHTTFSHYPEGVEPLLEKIALTIYDKRLRRLQEGESFEKA
jgi:L-ascorbate metabolism protein UlaG (beta-lactamase superfamily)